MTYSVNQSKLEYIPDQQPFAGYTKDDSYIRIIKDISIVDIQAWHVRTFYRNLAILIWIKDIPIANDPLLFTIENKTACSSIKVNILVIKNSQAIPCLSLYLFVKAIL